MSTIIPNLYCQVTQEWRMAGAPHNFMVVTGHVWGGTYTPDGVASRVRTRYKERGFDPLTGVGSNWSLGRTRALCRDSGGDLLVGEDPTVSIGTGTATANAPANSCVLVQKKTGIAGRKYRGRMFLPTYNLAEGFVDPAGYIASEQLSALQTMWSDFLADLVVDELDMVLLHSGAETPTPVTALAVQPLLATQRKRMRG